MFSHSTFIFQRHILPVVPTSQLFSHTTQFTAICLFAEILEIADICIYDYS